MESAPATGLGPGDVDRIAERIQADLDEIEACLERAHAAADASAAGTVRRKQALDEVDAALGELNLLLNGSDGES